MDSVASQPDRLSVFISYVAKDGYDRAIRLHDTLAEGGLTAELLPQRFMDSSCGFDVELETKIQASSHVVICCTASLREDWDIVITRTISFGQLCSRPLLLLLFDPYSKPDIPTQVDYLEQLNYSESDTDASKLIECLNRLTFRAPPIENDQFRVYLHQLYKDIVNQLVSSINLGTVPSIESVPWSRTSRAPLESGVNLRFANLGVGRNHFDGCLALVGEPGSGKTTALMSSARDAVAQRLMDPSQPLPFVARIRDYPVRVTPVFDRPGGKPIGLANLSPSFGDWLAATSSQDPGLVAQQIKEGRTVVFLDGLDELAATSEVKNPLTQESVGKISPRSIFLTAAKAALKGNQQLITYTTSTPKQNEVDSSSFFQDPVWDGWGIVTLCPWDETQIDYFFSQYPDIYVAFKQSSLLKTLMQTPIWVNLFKHTYLADSDDLFNALALIDAKLGVLQRQLIKSYVAARYQASFSGSSANSGFTLEQIYQVLGWAALADINNWGQNLILKQVLETSLGKNTQSFINHIVRLGIASTSLDSQHLYFVHTHIRDYFAVECGLLHLDMEDGNHQGYVLGGLSKVTTIDVVEPLIVLARTGRITIRRSAMVGLALCGSAEAASAIIELICSYEEPLLFVVAKELFKLGGKKLLLSFTALISVSDRVSNLSSRPTTACIVKILKAVSLSVLEPLHTLLGMPDNEVRISVVETLGLLGHESSISPLINALNDSDAEVMAGAAKALGRIGLPAIDALLDHLRITDTETTWLIALALSKMGSNAVDKLTNVLKDESPDLRCVAAIALGEIRDLRAVDTLITLLEDDNHDVRWAAASALGKIGDSKAVEPLILTLDTADSLMRVVVASALGALKDERAIRSLSELLTDVSVVDIEDAVTLRVCGVAEAALKLIGSASALAAIAQSQKSH